MGLTKQKKAKSKGKRSLQYIAGGPAYTFCDNRGLGLAMWDTADSYEDLKYLATTVIKADLWTALNNEGNAICSDKIDCDSNLIWRQTTTTPGEYFQASSAYNR